MQQRRWVFGGHRTAVTSFSLTPCGCAFVPLGSYSWCMIDVVVRSASPHCWLAREKDGVKKLAEENSDYRNEYGVVHDE